MRPTYLEVDLDAIAHNVAAIGELIAPSEMCSVVKADAYGHGDVPVANAAMDAGSTRLAVALVEEGVRLREAGVDAPILVLSEPSPDSVADVVAWDLEPTIYTPAMAEALARSGRKVRVHVKVDTGMHRVGAPPADLDDLVNRVEGLPGLELASLWTHFPVADEDPGFTTGQIERFDELTSAYPGVECHMANTAGAILFAESRRDMCRVGLGTYGLHPCPETVPLVDLRPAMRLVTHVSHVQRLPAGERLSYGRVRPLPAEATVVTAPVGYADGYARALTRDAGVLIHGRRFPLAGTVTMDQIVVDVGDEDVAVGDEVVLLGDQGVESISADELASALGTISYEVVCSIGPRVPRRYL